MLLKGTIEKIISQEGGLPSSFLSALLKVGLPFMKMYLHH